MLSLPSRRSALPAMLLAASFVAPASADTVVLEVTHTASASEAELTWSGGLAPYQVYRASAPGSVAQRPNLIDRTSLESYLDPGAPPPGSAFYYRVLEGVCGDAIADLDEECDGADLAGETCESLGFAAGTLLCDAACAFDASQCSGPGSLNLTLTRSGAGIITVNGAASCTGTCSQTTQHPSNSMVTLVAQPQNGSGHYFGGWGGDCSGILRTCVVSMTQARHVTASFAPLTHNLAFVSSMTFAANLGSSFPYDQRCNQLAAAAGINNAFGNDYTAWIADTAASPTTRMSPNARGWIRLDGAPLGDTLADMLGSSVIFHPVRIDELGQDTGSVLVMTGTRPDGSAGFTCNNWFGSGTMTFGFSGFGPGGWTSFGIAGCAASGRIYCLGNSRSAPVSITPEAGKLIYLSGPFPPSILASPEDQCQADIPVGVTAVKPLLATSTTPAGSALDPGQTYVRLDGVLIGTGAELITQTKLHSGIWQTGAGDYVSSPFAWTGHPDLTGRPSPADTCEEWQSFFDMAGVGYASATNALWFNGGTLPCSTNGVRLYCVEQ